MTVIPMNQQQFEQALAGGRLFLVEFQAPWCVYCRRISPALEKIARAYGDRLTVGTINIDDEPELAAREQIEVVPTLILYRDGQAVGSLVAPDSKAAIDGLIRESLPA